MMMDARNTIVRQNVNIFRHNNPLWHKNPSDIRTHAVRCAVLDTHTHPHTLQADTIVGREVLQYTSIIFACCANVTQYLENSSERARSPGRAHKNPGRLLMAEQYAGERRATVARSQAAGPVSFSQ